MFGYKLFRLLTFGIRYLIRLKSTEINIFMDLENVRAIYQIHEHF